MERILAFSAAIAAFLLAGCGGPVGQYSGGAPGALESDMLATDGVPEGEIDDSMGTMIP